MATAISMPRLGMTMEQGTVVEWPVGVGDRVEKGALVLVIESEKNEVEIDAPASGVLRHVYVEAGETVPCGALLGAITATADEAFDADAFRATADRPRPTRGGALRVGRAGSAAEKADDAASPHERPVAPAARAAAKRLGIDPQQVRGTGPGGRVTREDVEEYAEARKALVPVAPGVALEVPTAGAGETVVLLPGLGTDASSFTRQIPVLAEGHRVLAVNPRGVGLSDAPAQDAYPVAQLAADAAATFEGSAHLIGASLGAAVALELALAQPERVRSLTLIAPFVRASPRLLAVADAWRRVAAEAAPETLAAALLPWFFSSDHLADEETRGRTVRGLAQTLARVPAATLDRMVAGIAAWSGSRSGDLGAISAPTLVLVATEDLLAPDGKSIAAAIPNAKLVAVEGAGHALALEAPEPVNDAITAHLAATP